MDRALVERARDGDEEAYTGLMAIAGDRLLAVAYRILRDLHLAEDAVQAAFLRAWRDLPTLRDPDRFEAWLTRIIVRARYLFRFDQTGTLLRTWAIAGLGLAVTPDGSAAFVVSDDQASLVRYELDSPGGS